MAEREGEPDEEVADIVWRGLQIIKALETQATHTPFRNYDESVPIGPENTSSMVKICKIDLT